MAEIDKSLPNVKQTINVPSPEEVQVKIEEQEQQKDPAIDLQQNEDGSVDVNFDPSIGSKEQGCLLYTSPSPRDATLSRMPSSA